MLDEQSSCCQTCGCDKGARPKFCSRKCSVRFATMHRSQEDSHRYYSKSYRNFFQSLLQKKQHDRQNISIDYLASIWEGQNGLCAVSGVPMAHIRGQGKVMTNVSIDRIDSDLGYEEGNIQLVCFIVNMMKHTLTNEGLIWWCRQIIDTQNNRTGDNRMGNLKAESPSKNRSFKRNSSAGRK